MLLNQIKQYAPDGESFDFNGQGYSSEEISTKANALDNLSSTICAIRNNPALSDDEKTAILMAAGFIQEIADKMDCEAREQGAEEVAASAARAEMVSDYYASVL